MPSSPQARIHHCMTSDGHGKVYLFGGYNTNYNKYFNDFWELSLMTNKWRLIRSQNSITSRIGSGMIYYKEKVFVLGGFNDDIGYLNDIEWINSLNPMKWESLKIKSVFPNISWCSTDIYKDNIIMFGGKINGDLSNKLYKLNLKNNSIKCVSIINGNITFKSRYCHSSTIIHNKLYVFGGTDESNNVCNDGLFFIDLDTNMVSNININIIPRTNHLMLNYQNMLIVFGGFNSKALNDIIMIDITTFKIEYSGKLPKSCYLFKGCVFDRIITIFGGKDDQYHDTKKTLHLGVNFNTNKTNQMIKYNYSSNNLKELLCQLNHQNKALKQELYKLRYANHLLQDLFIEPKQFFKCYNNNTIINHIH